MSKVTMANRTLEAALYVVSTPIGNLADMTHRAVQVLQAADLIAAEDTRHSGQLLQHFDIGTPMAAYHDHSDAMVAERLLEKIEAGQAVALISDAGTPLIADPGYKLVSQARARNIRVVPVPGPSALITALSVAGLPTDRFIFEGFLPAKAEGRRKQLAGLALEPRTLVFYESPHRVQDSLKAMVEVFGIERKAVLARELTKRFETLIADSLGNLLERVAADQNQQRGEIVLAVEGLSREQQQADELPELEKMLIVLLAELSVKQSVALAVRLTGVNKNTVYEMALRLNKAVP
ncbi:16S rRNA (cytidine(1402)-2'-O)-methyltransferase [Pseudomonadales bacterium]|nr:16S rRNA (cytidine(1402)-2'-O)-methyltransferase [Pseudomonadales bacterium]MDB4421293.1 16S rRNA (cytidine(1402)-2'-O)-methyltransferase [Pseudomonadales bacterium]MDB4431579.1 16S rRNA (cytidine(1402)-2'-O)-methyltransferase [Pseudomonadales bacterium]MDB4451217.1 16S rRNA (cytidine(1402)-2'-O)-methyltransferase [Pseudomonadales bacterium]MDB4493022.1 16S rRNA (cytidine(1402)-2'-O)-methyltransferase [Pseudomonadales bacterium]